MPQSEVLAKIGFTILALVGLAVHHRYGLSPDQLTIVLVVCAVLPWASYVLQEFELPGGWKVKFREIKREQTRQKSEIDTLKFLIASFLTDAELTHLRKINGDLTPEYERSGYLEDELRHLFHMALIEKHNLNWWLRTMPHQGKLTDYFKATTRGKEFLQLRSKMTKETTRTA